MNELLLVCHSCKTWLLLGLGSSIQGVLPAEVNGELFKATLCAFLYSHDSCQLKYERHDSNYNGLPISLENYQEFTESESYRRLAIKKPEQWYVLIIENSKKEKA